VVAANFIAVAARMSLVTFLGIYFVRQAGFDVGTVGLAFLAESLLRGAAAPMFGALSDRIGRRMLLIVAALVTAIVLPSFLLVNGPASLFAWSVAMGLAGAINMPVATAMLLDLAPSERRQSVLAANYTAMSVAYTLGVSPAGYVAEQSYVALAVVASTGYLLVAALYALALRAPRPVERNEAGVLRETVAAFRDRVSPPRHVRVPLSMAVVIVSRSAMPDGEGYIGLCSAVTASSSRLLYRSPPHRAARPVPASRRRGFRCCVRYRVLRLGAGSGRRLPGRHRGV
jgi:MFS family permease